MKMCAVEVERPDIIIRMSGDEADWLLGAMQEAKAYASDCAESTERHEKFIEDLETIIESQ